MSDVIPDESRYRADHARFRAVAHPLESECRRVLQQFRSHSLNAQVKVDLQNRTESKYVLPVCELPRFLQALAADHTVLENVGQRIMTYENTYFDTPTWDLYLHHHNGKLNRRKYRYRRYLETDTANMEVKFKNNKHRTVKQRLSWNRGESAGLHSSGMPLAARLYVNYRRITLWNHNTDERLTLDFDIYYERPQQEPILRLPDVLVVELKRDGKVYGSPFVRWAREHHYVRQSISKYCVGVCLTGDGDVKHNKFKPLIRKLHRIQHTGDAA